MLSLFILLSFVYPFINMIKFITTEKEKQLKESMKIMGLPSWLHWTAWFCKCFTYLFFSTGVMLILLKAHWYPDMDVTVFTKSSWSVLWFFLLVYSVATIMFVFMLSVFFSKGKTLRFVAFIDRCFFFNYSKHRRRRWRTAVVCVLCAIFISHSTLRHGNPQPKVGGVIVFQCGNGIWYAVNFTP